MLDLRQTRSWANYLQNLNWKVFEINGSYIYVRDIPLIPLSIVKIQRANKNFSEKDIKNLLSKKRISIVYIEPVNDLQKDYYIDFGYHLSKSTSLPSKTILVNLKNSIEQIYSKLDKKVRYGIRLCEKNRITVEKSTDYNRFIMLWNDNLVRRKGLLPQKKEIKELVKNFTQNRTIFMFARHKDIDIAGIMLIMNNKTSHYMYAVSNKDGYKFLAPTLLVWEAIKYSKSRNMDLFDFDGIYDSRYPQKSWIGFSNFKSSFGGSEYLYPDSVQKTYFPWSL